MAAFPPRYEIQITPITMGPLSDPDQAYDIEFRCKNIGTLPLPQLNIMVGVIRSGFSTLSVANGMHVPPLDVEEEAVCRILERPLVDGGMVFSIVYLGKNNDMSYYVNKEPLGIKDQDGRLITPSRIFHGVRVRSKEELSNIRASRATLYSLILLVGFQVIDWMIPFDAVLSIQQSCVLLSVLVFSIIGINFSFIIDYAIEKIKRHS